MVTVAAALEPTFTEPKFVKDEVWAGAKEGIVAVVRIKAAKHLQPRSEGKPITASGAVRSSHNELALAEACDD